MSDGRLASGSTGNASPADERAAEEAAIEVLQTGTAREASLPEHLRYLSERERALRLELRRSAADQEHTLRKQYARWILVILAGQFVVSDAVFVAYAWAGENWHLESSVIQGWLAAMVVQIVGVAHVVTRHLFPNRDGVHLGRDSESE